MAVQLGDRLVQVCEAACGAVTTAWEPAEPDECTRDWVTEEDLATLEGRKVFVLPGGAKTIDRLTRGSLLNEYAVSIRVIERYTDRDRPPAVWIDERVKFLDTILGALDITAAASYLLGSLWTETIEVTEVCDLTELMVRKLFYAEIEVAFREKAAA